MRFNFFTKKLVIAALFLIILGLICFLSAFFVSPKGAAAFNSFGASVLTAGIISLFIDSIAVAETKKTLVRSVIEILEGLRHGNELYELGIQKILESLEKKELIDAVKGGKNLVLVLTWSTVMRPILREISSVIERGGDIEIFLLHPGSDIAKHRSEDLDEDPDHVPENIRSNINSIRRLYQKLGCNDKLRLRLYNCLPTCTIYKVDDKIWMGLYWMNRVADNSINFVMDSSKENQILFEQYSVQISSLSKKSIPVDLSKECIPTLEELRVHLAQQ